MDAPEHIFFDMDGTLTESRCVIEPEMYSALTTLRDKQKDVVIVSGAHLAQIEAQLGSIADRCFKLSQSGNHCFGTGHEELWCNELDWKQKHDILWWIYESLHFRGWQAYDLDLVEDRGCQISYSLIGHHMEQGIKDAFDPDQKKRKELLEKFPFVPLSGSAVEAVIGGTTCIDFIESGKTKGRNIAELLQQLHWKKEDCLYIGDKLFPGGNDESVIGVIPTKAVASPQECLDVINSIV